MIPFIYRIILLKTSKTIQYNLLPSNTVPSQIIQYKHQRHNEVRTPSPWHNLVKTKRARILHPAIRPPNEPSQPLLHTCLKRICIFCASNLRYARAFPGIPITASIPKCVIHQGNSGLDTRCNKPRPVQVGPQNHKFACNRQT